MSKLMKFLVIVAGISLLITIASFYGMAWYSQDRYKGGTGIAFPAITAGIFGCISFVAIMCAIELDSDERKAREKKEREDARTDG